MTSPTFLLSLLLPLIFVAVQDVVEVTVVAVDSDESVDNNAAYYASSSSSSLLRSLNDPVVVNTLKDDPTDTTSSTMEFEFPLLSPNDNNEDEEEYEELELEEEQLEAYDQGRRELTGGGRFPIIGLGGRWNRRREPHEQPECDNYGECCFRGGGGGGNGHNPIQIFRLGGIGIDNNDDDICSSMEDDTDNRRCFLPQQICERFNRYQCGNYCCRSFRGREILTFPIKSKCLSRRGRPSWCDLSCSTDAAFGDPHFKTWHKRKDFEYHGECDLVLLKAPILDMDIHVRTTIRYDYSFVSQVAIRIGQEIFEVASWGEYQLDGMASIDLPTFFIQGGYPITKETLQHGKKIVFKIHLDQDKSIIVVSYKDYVSVRIDNGTSELFGESTGLMGDFQTGTMYGRDGKTIYHHHDNDQVDQYAEEWQVQPKKDGILFAGPRYPQYPHKCIKPSPDAISAHARKLGEAAVMISREDAEGACSHWPMDLKAACIKDVLKTQDLDIAEASFW